MDTMNSSIILNKQSKVLKVIYWQSRNRIDRPYLIDTMKNSMGKVLKVRYYNEYTYDLDGNCVKRPCGLSVDNAAKDRKFELTPVENNDYTDKATGNDSTDKATIRMITRNYINVV